MQYTEEEPTTELYADSSCNQPHYYIAFHNAVQLVVQLAREEDKEGRRTIGVLTKADMIEPGTHDTWLPVLQVGGCRATQGREHTAACCLVGQAVVVCIALKFLSRGSCRLHSRSCPSSVQRQFTATGSMRNGSSLVCMAQLLPIRALNLIRTAHARLGSRSCAAAAAAG
jgi:hypothetical protein